MNRSRGRHQRGGAFQDYLLAISVVTVSAIGVGALLVSGIRDGSDESGQKVEQVLSGDQHIAPGDGNASSSGGGLDGSHPPIPKSQGGTDGDPEDGLGASPAPGDDSSAAQKSAPPPSANAPDGTSKCRYSYDSGAAKWKDPATGAFVSDSIAAQSGC